MRTIASKIVLPLILFGIAACAGGFDWAQWRGPERTGYVPAGEKVPAILPAPLKVLWHQEVGFAVASPVVADGRVFHLDNVNGRETVHALDARNGDELWAVDLDKATQDLQSASGPRTTPLVDRGRVFCQSCRGTLKVLNAADGKLIWETNYVKDFGSIFIGEKGKAEGASRHGHTAAPLIDGEHLIAEVGGPGAGVVCFDKATGKVIWKSQDDMAGYAAPILATIAGKKQLIAFMADGLIGLDSADGALLWRVPLKTRLGRHAVTPVVVGDRVVVSSHQIGMVGVQVSKEGSVFKANIAWTNKAAPINFASPVTVGPYLYGVGPNKNLICIDTNTGAQMWSKDNFFSSSGGKAYAGMIVMGENILILADDGQLVLMAADPKAYDEISRAQGCGKNWCSPAYADGKLYLRDAHEMRCLQLLP